MNPKMVSWNRRLDAGALYYVIIVCLFIALITGSIFSVLSLHQKIEMNLLSRQKAIHNVLNGLELFKNQAYRLKHNKWIDIDLYGDGKDSVRVCIKTWGQIEVHASSSKVGKYRFAKAAFIAPEITPAKRVVLKLEDNNRPLSLCGNAVISGDAWLPKAGVKRAYVEGNTFQGKQLINGNSKTISSKYKQMKFPILDGLIDSLLKIDPYTFNQFSHEYHSFLESEVKFLNVNQSSEIHARGQIVVWSLEPLIIDSTSTIEDAIVIAPEIRIKNGFKGNGQFLATDSLIVEREVALQYPSILYVSRRELSQIGIMRLESGSEVNGLIALIDHHPSQNSQSGLKIENQAMVRGQVICNSPFDHQGIILGMAEASRFLLQTPSSTYENYLIDATIDAISLDSSFLFLASDTIGVNHIAKWVN